jgi:hypothetical protein
MTRILAGLVLVLALALGWSLWRSEAAARKADTATERAVAAEARADALGDALARDGVSAAFTDTARQAMDASAAETNARLRAIEGRLHDRPPVPAVCPGPDPVLVRESEEGSGRVRAAEGRLRDLRTAED